MIYRRFVDRDGLLHAVIAHFYKERIKGLIAKAESLAAQEPPATVEDLIAAIPPPDYPGSAEVHGLMSRVPALASENESFRLDIQNFIEEHFPRMRSAVRKIISRFPVEYQFDDRIINILILNQSWTFNDLRGSQRTSNEEYHDFLRTLFRAPASR
jgi:AcrR family transcriptional regulator